MCIYVTEKVTAMGLREMTIKQLYEFKKNMLIKRMLTESKEAYDCYAYIMDRIDEEIDRRMA